MSRFKSYFCIMIYELMRRVIKFGCKVVNNESQINYLLLLLGDMTCECYIVIHIGQLPSTKQSIKMP